MHFYGLLKFRLVMNVFLERINVGKQGTTVSGDESEAEGHHYCWRSSRSVVPNLGPADVLALQLPENLHPHLCWPGFLGVEVKEHLEAQGWGPLA